MGLRNVGRGATASLFTDTDTGVDYAVAPREYNGWEHLYTVVRLDNGQPMYNVDGATPGEALRAYLEHGPAAAAQLGSLHCDGKTVYAIIRPGCDTEYRVSGTASVCTVERGTGPLEWVVHENGSEAGTSIESGSAVEAVLEYSIKKKGVVDV